MPMVNTFSSIFFENLTPEVTAALFDLHSKSSFWGHFISMEHSYCQGYRNRGKSTWRIHSYYFYVTNITVDGTIDLFDLQEVILEVILYQQSTHTVMGTEIGVNPNGESSLTVFMSLTKLSTALLTFLTSKLSSIM